ncbi:LEAF RUST 10 DISEASE-RESISTANCE LOCUS RECEPTOR-LIKE PROTEIN KINASE-like 1.1 isoform X2 [Arachis stenosperma]|uniref:LEAF RUST 10 DISEASE-RESISTANCE LOCUS RECEPTOR-LIKE PROTEIN KINASE-like 1.1 isoform X2 n=1 Tax=Arachis stenosperma TaxID=217475 RepID=UPI0025ACBD9C|nr:LEAF RUST 10 DISEASE-RESISTANCE LOCUS RECEPTOR-LIKE PROTEIN KINASE-like 1.1 isoform X2 [Arachis stenosperma]
MHVFLVSKYRVVIIGFAVVRYISLMKWRCALFECCFACTTSDASTEFDIKSQLPNLGYTELSSACHHFHPSKNLGTRAYHKVYHGILEDFREVAIQRLSASEFQFIEKHVEGCRIRILSLLPHKNVVSVYGYSSNGKEFLLAHEYVPNGALHNHLHGQGSKRLTLPWDTRLDIAIDVANALAYLHSNGIIHNQVTSHNILLDENLGAKVKNCLGSWQLARGPSGFVSHNGEFCLNFKNDIYSFGVVLCELLTSKPSYMKRENLLDMKLATFTISRIENNALEEILDPSLGFESDPAVKQMLTSVAVLAYQCLIHDVPLRPSMAQVLEGLKGIREQRRDLNLTAGKLPQGYEVAIKRFHEKKEKTRKQFTREVEILSLMRHQNLVSLYGRSSDDSDELLLVYEYVSNGSLSTYLHRNSGNILPWATRLNIAIETASALAYLHHSGIIHRDVKPSNILLDKNLSAKVADFGLARFLPLGDLDFVTHVSTAPVGTPAYIDPENFEFNKVSDKSDVYSYGMVLFQLISSMPSTVRQGPQLFTLANFAMGKILNNELEELVDPSLGFHSDSSVMETITAVAELAFQCVQHPKEFRLSMKQVLETLEGIKQGSWGFNQIT